MRRDDLPHYLAWDLVPGHLKTKTGWRREGLRPADLDQPAAWCWTRAGCYALYSRDACQAPQVSPGRGQRRKDWPAIFSEYYEVPIRWGAAVASLSDVSTDAPLAGILRDACSFLWSLNRYAKHDACSSRQRTAIYDLKTRLLRGLFLGGYCINAYRAASPIHEAVCYACHGSGGCWNEDDSWNDYYGEECWKCGGTGIYRSGGRPYWALTFQAPAWTILTYRWHQPAHLASWAHTIGAPPAEGPEQVMIEKNQPIGLAKRRIPEAVAHLRWMAENLEYLYPIPQPTSALLQGEYRTRYDWLPTRPRLEDLQVADAPPF